MLKEYQNNQTELAQEPQATHFLLSPLIAKVLFWAVLAICAAIVAIKVVARLSVASVWDDSFMFGRYAGNFLQSGKISWNPSGPATYGLTSPLFLVIVTPLRLIFGDRPGVVGELSSLIPSAIFLVLLFVLLDRFTNCSKAVRRSIILLIAVALTTQANYFEVHITSGMDTTFALAYLTAYIILWKIYQNKSVRWVLITLGLLGGLAFSVRPDLMLFTVVVPGILFLTAPNWSARRSLLAIGGISVAVLVLQLIFSTFYFHSTLPLSFYAKSLRLYGPDFVSKYTDVAAHEFLNFLGAWWFLFALPIAGLVFNLKTRWREINWLNLSLGLATALLIFYYLLTVIQVMGFISRFYYPAFPVLAFLAVESAGSLSRKINQLAQKWSLFVRRSRWPVLGASVVGGLFVAGFWVWPGFTYSVDTVNQAVKAGTFLHFRVAENYLKNSFYPYYWFRLDEFSALPNDLVIATTEVGYPAAMNPHKTIIDMAGLNETEFAHQQFSANLLFSRYQPDLIFMPNPDYKAMIQDLSNNPYFMQHYDFYPSGKIAAEMGVAIRRDSKYYAQMKYIIEHK